MTHVTSKTLHEQTGSLLDRIQAGERFLVFRNGKPQAVLMAATDQVDPTWDELLLDVRKARASNKGRNPNLVLSERKARNHASRLR